MTGPLPENDPEFRLLVGRALIHAGCRYRNCIAGHLGQVAAGQKLIYEWLGELGAVIELNCLFDSSGKTYFSTGQIEGVGNSEPPIQVLNAIRSLLSQHGVLFTGAATGQFDLMKRLLAIYNDYADWDVGDTYASLVDDAEELPELSIRAA